MILKSIISNRTLRLACLAVIVLSGCAPYRLQGRVIEGQISTIEVVEADDPRLDGEPLPDVRIEAILDPSSIRPQRVGATHSDLDGRFRIPIEAMGAGSWQEYELGIASRLTGYRDQWETMRLPSSRYRLLVIMQPGQGGRRPPTDLYDESLRLQEQFMSP